MLIFPADIPKLIVPDRIAAMQNTVLCILNNPGNLLVANTVHGKNGRNGKIADHMWLSER
ncbi:hypothetical protein D3C87_2053480 [compost metagenome]